MGNYCGTSGSKLEKHERDELIYLLKKTETRLEFYKKLHELSQYNYTLNRTKTRQIFDILRDIIVKEKKYQDKFYCVVFLNMLLRKYEKARERFASSMLMSVVLDSLRTETDNVKALLEMDKIKLWKERYLIVCVELACFLVQYNRPMFQRYNEFLVNNGIDVNREPFYSKITHPLIVDIKTDAGGLTREPTHGGDAGVRAIPARAGRGRCG